MWQWQISSLQWLCKEAKEKQDAGEATATDENLPQQVVLKRAQSPPAHGFWIRSWILKSSCKESKQTYTNYNTSYHSYPIQQLSSHWLLAQTCYSGSAVSETVRYLIKQWKQETPHQLTLYSSNYHTTQTNLLDWIPSLMFPYNKLCMTWNLRFKISCSSRVLYDQLDSTKWPWTKKRNPIYA